LTERTSAMLVLDKPSGMTSQQAVTRVKRLLSFRKAGHSGILDPDVTGVLPILFGSATRLAEYITDATKAYEAFAVLGFSTDTQDATGQILATGDPAGVTDEQIQQALRSFVGHIEQVPPQYSALKVGGVRAYTLARKGIEAPLVPRTVRVEQIAHLATTRAPGKVTIHFRILCGKGTYVRTICHDLGKQLGVPAHMASLIRTQSGPFTLSDAVSLSAVEEQGRLLLMAPEVAVAHLPKIVVEEQEAVLVDHGARLRPRDWPLAIGQDVRVHDQTDELLAIYTVVDNAELAAKKVLVTREAT